MLSLTPFRARIGRDGAHVRLWALGVSAALHVGALAALGAFHFSRSADTAGVGPAAVSVHAIERVLDQSEPKPKPQVEPAAAPTVSAPAVERPPVPHVRDLPVPQVDAPAAPAPRAAPNLFFGAETTAGRVCYVVDGSGSMFGLMYLVREQLRESILKLSAEQSFNVVFCMQNGRLVQAFDGRLEPATAGSKAEALNVLGRIRPEGQTRAEQGLESALGMRDRSHRRPEVIYFVTDGFDLMEGGGDKLIGRVEKLRKTLAPDVIVHTIGVYPARQDGVILSQLAKACGGRYIEIN